MIASHPLPLLHEAPAMETTRLMMADDACPGPLVCHCLGVCERTVVDAIATFGLRTVKDVRHCTGAGDGCTACHGRLREYLARHSSSDSPICSVR
jgi:NAD(P)H-nitrite reductase large subunit